MIHLLVSTMAKKLSHIREVGELTPSVKKFSLVCQIMIVTGRPIPLGSLKFNIFNFPCYISNTLSELQIQKSIRNRRAP